MPREVHEHQDADGNITGFTVIRRESEWDEATRERVQRLAEYEASLCPCGCGVPVDLAWDPFFEPWAVDSFTCYARRALEGVRRTWEDGHKDVKGDAWRDGVEHYVVAPDEGEHNVEKAETAAMRKRGPGGH